MQSARSKFFLFKNFKEKQKRIDTKSHIEKEK